MGIIRGVVNRGNINKVCRLCLEEKPNIQSLKVSLEIEEDNIKISILDIFHIITSNPIKLEGLPDTICKECQDLVKASYVFKLKFEESHTILDKYLETAYKEEDESVNEELCESVPNDEIFSAYDGKTNCTQSRKKQRFLKCVERKAILVSNSIDENYSYKELETNSTLHPCPICTLELTASELKLHAHTHKALKKYLNIPQKLMITPNTRFVAKHGNNVSLFNKAEKLHKCPYCDSFFNVLQFRIHIDKHRKEDEFKCEKCERVFRKLNHLNTHRVKHLKEFPYKCEQCNKGFVIKTNYDCHILTHNNEELPHECTYCLKRFSNPEHLNRHQIIHTENVTYSVKYKVCKCHQCLKTFKGKDELQKHICTPLEQAINTPFPCKTCKKVFKHSSGLYNHNRNIHKLKGAKILCSVCGHYVSNIYNHMMRHSGEKPYQCNQCEKRFIAKPQLRQHLLVHSGVKPYVCSVCAKAFNNLYNLQVHERIHKGDRCHICQICNKGFLEKSYLKKHMNIHKAF